MAIERPPRINQNTLHERISSSSNETYRPAPPLPSRVSIEDRHLSDRACNDGPMKEPSKKEHGGGSIEEVVRSRLCVSTNDESYTLDRFWKGCSIRTPITRFRGGVKIEEESKISSLIIDQWCVYVYMCVCVYVGIPRDFLYTYIYILNLYTYIYIRVLLYFLILEEFHFSLSHLGS